MYGGHFSSLQVIFTMKLGMGGLNPFNVLDPLASTRLHAKEL